MRTPDCDYDSYLRTKQQTLFPQHSGDVPAVLMESISLSYFDTIFNHDLHSQIPYMTGHYPSFNLELMHVFGKMVLLWLRNAPLLSVDPCGATHVVLREDCASWVILCSGSILFSLSGWIKDNPSVGNATDTFLELNGHNFGL